MIKKRNHVNKNILRQRLYEYYNSFPDYFSDKNDSLDNMPWLLQCFNLAKIESILNVGCGSDELTIELCSYLGIASVVGMDFSTIAIKYMNQVADRTHVENVSLVVGDAETIPFEDNSFELVFSKSVLEHLVAPYRSVDEMCRVSRNLVAFETANYCSPFLTVNETGVKSGGGNMFTVFKAFFTNLLSLNQIKRIAISLSINTDPIFLSPPLRKRATGGDVEDLVAMINIRGIEKRLKDNHFRIVYRNYVKRGNTLLLKVLRVIWNYIPILRYFGPTIKIIAKKM